MAALTLDPDVFLTVVESAADDIEEQVAAERRLRSFVRQAWPIVEPGRELVPGFYIDAICDHLQAVVDGDIRRLLITIPPGFLKSTIVSVLFPAWLWIDSPSFRFLTTSHDSDLAMRDAVRSRRVIASDWYQARWGGRFAMTTDQNVKTRYENDKTGHRISLGTGSGITGKRGDMIICDDPSDAEDAWSETAREATIRWWNETVPSRLNDPKTGAKIVIQQRIHERDLAGEVASQGYEHLNLPMEYEPEAQVSVTSIGWRDPRTEPGQVLDPVRYGPGEIAEKRRELGTQAYAAQFQQRPVPLEGGILKAEWFGVTPVDPHYVAIVQAWDTAFKTGAGNDYSVCLTLGIALDGYDILDVWRDRVEFPELERAASDQATIWRSRFSNLPFTLLVEDQASGQSLIQSIQRRTRHPVIAAGATRPNEKLQKVHEIAPTVEARRVRLPAVAHWRDAFLHEITAFPYGTHDDQVDAFAIALRRAVGLDQSAGASVEAASYLTGASRRIMPGRRRGR